MILNPAIGIFLLFACMFFIWFEMPIPAVVTAIASFFVFNYPSAKNFGSKIMDEMEEAEGQVPDQTVWIDGIKEMGARTGETFFSDYEQVASMNSRTMTKWKFKPKKLGEAAKKTKDSAKKLFG